MGYMLWLYGFISEEVEYFSTRLDFNVRFNSSQFGLHPIKKGFAFPREFNTQHLDIRLEKIPLIVNLRRFTWSRMNLPLGLSLFKWRHVKPQHNRR